MALSPTDVFYPIRALTKSISNLDRRLRKVETREVPAATDGGGVPDGPDLNYIHIQSSPSAVWTVNHNLGKFPAIDVVDTGGSTVIPDIFYDNAFVATVTFGSATSGRAFCN